MFKKIAFKKSENPESVLILLLYLTTTIPIAVFPFLINPYSTSKFIFFAVLIGLSAIFFTISLIKNKRTIKIDLVTILFSIFLLIIFLTSLNSVRPLTSFFGDVGRNTGFVFYLAIFIYFIILKNLFDSKDDVEQENFWKTFFNFIIIVSSSLSVYGILQYFGFFDIHQVANPDGIIRVNSTIGNSALFAEYLVLTIFVSFFVLLRKKHSFKMIALYLILIFTQVWALFLTSSRAGFLALISGLVVLSVGYLWSSKKISKKVKIIFFSASIFSLVAFVVVLFLANNKIDQYFEARGNTTSPIYRIINFNLQHKSIQDRFTLYTIGYESFLDKPIAGWGVENFIIPYDLHYKKSLNHSERWNDRTHNIFLDWLVHTGIFGLILYVLFVSCVIYYLFTSKLGLREKCLLFPVIVAYFANNFFMFETITGLITIIPIMSYVSFKKDSNTLYVLNKKILSFFLIIFILLILITASSKFLSYYYLHQAMKVQKKHPENSLSLYKKSFKYEINDVSTLSYFLTYSHRVLLKDYIDEQIKTEHISFSLNKISELEDEIRYSPGEAENVSKYFRMLDNDEKGSYFIDMVKSYKIRNNK